MKYSDTSHSSMSDSALVPVSSAVSTTTSELQTLDKRLQELRALYETLPCPSSVPSVCSCPTTPDKDINSTALRLYVL